MGPSGYADPESRSYAFKMIDSSKLLIRNSLFDLSGHGLVLHPAFLLFFPVRLVGEAATDTSRSPFRIGHPRPKPQLNGTVVYASGGMHTNQRLELPETANVQFIESFTPSEFDEYCSQISLRLNDFGRLTRQFVYQTSGGRPKLFRRQIMAGFHGKFS